MAGLDKLFKDAGVFDQSVGRWPTIPDLLAWLLTVRLKGRAAMWQASAERILLAMTYGEFGAVVNTQDNSHVRELLDRNVILEMDGLSSNSDRTMFSEALTLYLYRYRLSQGPQRKLTNLIVLEEAHNLLLQKSADAKESILENSIRMIRQYGMGYVFVDQSASLLSKVAFANSYATLALSQKLRGDVQAIAGAMNLTDEQKEALNTLPIGTAIVRLADEFPEPFLVRVPRFPIEEGSISDERIRDQMAGYFASLKPETPRPADTSPVPPIPRPDKNTFSENCPHPPSPRESPMTNSQEPSSADSEDQPPDQEPVGLANMSREDIRFLADVAARPLSTTVVRYQRLNLSRRRGNAVRQHLEESGILEAVGLATRSGQVVLYQLTDFGRTICEKTGIDPGAASRESLEHRYWIKKAHDHFAAKGLEITREYPVPGDGAVDLLAERPGERIAIEIETGKSDIKENLTKLGNAGFDRLILIATSPEAISACTSAMKNTTTAGIPQVELLTWLDIS